MFLLVKPEPLQPIDCADTIVRFEVSHAGLVLESAEFCCASCGETYWRAVVGPIIFGGESEYEARPHQCQKARPA